jgi:hypothetical protein
MLARALWGAKTIPIFSGAEDPDISRLQAVIETTLSSLERSELGLPPGDVVHSSVGPSIDLG